MPKLFSGFTGECFILCLCQGVSYIDIEIKIFFIHISWDEALFCLEFPKGSFLGSL